MGEFKRENSLGALPAQDIVNYLIAIEDLDEASRFSDGGVTGQGLPGYHPAYSHTGMVVGFIEPSEDAELQIQSASSIQADRTLQGQRIKVTLDRFFVESYPGLGEHIILCEFNGKNQIQPAGEALKFAKKFSANDRSAAAVVNAPVFLGLTVSNDGIEFEGRTINVRSKGSEAILAALESPVFKAGLTLINTAQPALKPFVSLATAAIKTVESGKNNKQVHEFNLGLDFDDRSTATRLRLGTYIVVQTDENSWDWTQFTWQRAASQLQDRRLPAGESIGFNYTAIGISRFESPEPVRTRR